MPQVERVSKNFGRLRALHGVSFQTDEGEIVGLNGPNGYGKSTAFNAITAHLPVTSGNLTRLRSQAVVDYKPVLQRKEPNLT